MFDKSNLIEVTKCVVGSTFKDKKDKDIQLYIVYRSVNGFPIDTEQTTKPIEVGYYYPRPFTKKIKMVNYKGETVERNITIARVGEKFEFPI